MQNNYELLFRERFSPNRTNEITEFTSRYSHNRNVLGDGRLGLTLEFTQQDQLLNKLQFLNSFIDFQKQLFIDHRINTTFGYNHSNGNTINRNGLNASINYEWFITDSIVLNTRINYNRNVIQTDINNIADSEFVTENQFDTTEESTEYEYNAFINLQYTFGRSGREEIIAGQRGVTGYGSVRGILYVDNNNDGILQAGEQRLSGVDIFLDRIYPIRTDSNGEYIFRNVGTGEHEIYIDEGSLPLPLSLEGVESYPIEVDLRSTTEFDIAVLDGSTF